MRRPMLAVGTYTLILLTALTLSAGSGAAADAPANGAPGSTLRVGIATNYPPMAFKQDGQITGVEADFAALLGKALDVKISLVETPFEELIPSLQKGQIDVIMSGMSITNDRKKLVAFTNPYTTISQMALYRAADAARFRKRAALDASTLRVGVVNGTTGEQYARKNHPHVQVKGFDSVDAGVAALRQGDVDIFVHDAPAIWRVTGGLESPERELTGFYEPLTEEHLAWAVRKQGAGALRGRLNTVLAKWKKHGQVESVLDRWITVRKQLIRARPKS
jgi:ABC-type amino acid transport substrate-binding protein